MRNLLGLGFIVLALGLAGTPGVAQSVPPRPVTMQDLTVPKDRLPDGCSLKVIEPQQPEVIGVSATVKRIVVTGSTQSMQPGGMSQVTSNPWIGKDRRILSELHQRVDGYGPVRLPDAPPLSRRETSALLLQFANGVEEGYAATYAQAGGRDLGVWAVRLAGDADSHRNPSARTIVEIGFIRAAVFGGGGACATAVETHLNSLRK